MVPDHREQYESEWQAIISIAGKLGCSEEALRRWIRRAEAKGQEFRRRFLAWPRNGHTISSIGSSRPISRTSAVRLMNQTDQQFGG